MAWITVDQFKSDFEAAKRASSGKVQMALDAAEDELVELVGQAAVTDALLSSPADAARAAKLIRGHKFLAASVIVFNVDNIKRQQDAASPATAQTIVNERFTPKELADLSDKWRQMALRVIAAYLIRDVEGDDYSSGFEYSHPAENDSCCRLNDCA